MDVFKELDIAYDRYRLTYCISKLPNLSDDDWDFVQKKYEEYCKQFSPTYLSGAPWYVKDFKKAYLETLWN